MTLEHIASVGTVVVAIAGIGGSLLATAQGRKHADRLAVEARQHERQERNRQDRLGVYASAMSHAVAQERRFNSVWAWNGGESMPMSPAPTGGPLSLDPIDQVTVHMNLRADDEVARAWAEFVDALEALDWWGANDRVGPDDDPPAGYEERMAAAIANLKTLCKRSLE